MISVRTIAAVLCLLACRSMGAGTKFMALEVDAPSDSLHDQMRSMMEDDDDEDLSNPSRPALMQTGTESDAYLQDSANSLTDALGPRWNGQQLEDDAKEKTDALLKGIAGHKALGSLNAML